ncbi:inositol monophosphatase family protein [Microbacterium sp. ASV81]|uniref:Inositol monophosphatase family protein n=1 Tax=Microbacterium capsulatum TaxID=3041921 RepID=A0ABU0XDP9_9MICO|nr:inositol monophosphatase family protein [Microbacterium sp. ASV81]MDQ4213237.1 inositol monophosphatase family protein [Microbacterium sp. ASV81]
MSFADHPERHEFVEFIEQLADAARSFLSGRHESGRFETKEDASPVTEFDRGVEGALRAMIRTRYPHHGIIGEEFHAENPDAEFTWIMDPIDGTKSFVVGIPVFTTLIALCHRGRPVIGLIDASSTDDRWIGVDGLPTRHNGRTVRTSGRTRLDGSTVSWSNPEVVLEEHRAGREALNRRTAWRVFGAAAYGVGRLASGAVDLAVESGTVGPYDICPFVPIIEGAGGVVTDGFGGPITTTTRLTCVAAATRELHAEALRVLNG